MWWVLSGSKLDRVPKYAATFDLRDFFFTSHQVGTLAPLLKEKMDSVRDVVHAYLPMSTNPCRYAPWSTEEFTLISSAFVGWPR